MNGREALKALADGKKVRATCWPSEDEFIYLDDSSALILRDPIAWDGDWEVVAEPATDEELIAEMERLGTEFAKESAATEVAQRCARMLRERKVAP
jgi:hypothetical protein